MVSPFLKTEPHSTSYQISTPLPLESLRLDQHCYMTTYQPSHPNPVESTSAYDPLISILTPLHHHNLIQSLLVLMVGFRSFFDLQCVLHYLEGCNHSLKNKANQDRHEASFWRIPFSLVVKLHRWRTNLRLQTGHSVEFLAFQAGRECVCFRTAELYLICIVEHLETTNVTEPYPP